MKKTAAITVCLLWLLLLLAASTPASSPSTFLVPHAEATENTWTTLEPIPTIRRNLGVAVVNGKIYAIGGTGEGGYLNTNEEYDPATNTWTTKTPMPTPRSDFGIAVFQNKIYCIGGIIYFDWSGYGEGILCAFNEVYDPLTDTWENKTSMPTKRQRPKANVVNGKIYLIGGFQYQDLPPPNTQIELNVNEAYDPETDSWSTKTPIPNTPYGPASATINNKIYVISGFHSDLNQIYDPESDTWFQGASIPTAVALAGAGATSGVMAPKRIYVIGGYPSYDEVSLNQVYNPETNTWSSGSQMPTARHSLGVAVINDTLYAIGGGSTNLNVRYYDENERYTPIGFGTAPDTTPPVISVVSPENKTYTANNVSLTFSGSEPIFSMRYSLDRQENVTITGNTTLTGLSDGSHSLTVYANDLFGNIGSSDTAYFIIDATFPSISILSPENKTYDTADIPLNFTVSESVSWIGYSLNGQASVTITGNTTLTGLSDGSHNVTVYAKDTAGNTGTSETIYFTIKTQQSEPFPITWIVAAIVIIVVVGTALLVYFRKIKKTTGKAEE